MLGALDQLRREQSGFHLVATGADGFWVEFMHLWKLKVREMFKKKKRKFIFFKYMLTNIYQYEVYL